MWNIFKKFTKYCPTLKYATPQINLWKVDGWLVGCDLKVVLV